MLAPALRGEYKERMAEKLKILIADDESIIRMDIRETLEGAGHTVIAEAGTGREALNLVEPLRPDVVLLDVKMPDLAGLAAAERIGAAKIAPVVLLTAYQDREYVERARAAGTHMFLVKPFKEEELLAALEMAVARFEEVRALEAELSDLKDKFETRKLVDKAKGVLMDTYKLKESEAFRLIQKRSMDERKALSAVAQEILTKAKTR